ncbi:MAG: DUF4476 domain-containing protein [Flavipsychrobacter sp.]
MFRSSSLKHIVFALLFVVAYAAQAQQQFSYVYIQGDKETPFYVKFEDEMLPRYGKNYCIIPMLAPGPINIEILFQQRAYPSQTFTIEVPENGNRSFLLKNKQGVFSLYDIEQKFYLPAGNTTEQDRIPNSRGIVYNTSSSTTPINTNTVPQTPTYRQPEQTPTIKKPTYNKPQETKSDNGEQPKFIANIQINSTSDNKTNVTTQKSPSTDYTEDTPPNLAERTPPPTMRQSSEQPRVIATTPARAITKPTRTQSSGNNKVRLHNSDCPTPITNNEFDNIYDKATNKSDKVRLKYLLSEVDKCFSTFQAKTLALTLPNDPERYTFLKRVYPRITDQEQFPVLENILSATDWKDYFKLIIPQ